MGVFAIISCFSICFLFHFLAVFSAGYTVPDRYFINCGSASPVPINGKAFAGDLNRVNSVSVPSSRVVEDRNSSAPELYRTARIFKKDSSYGFEIDDEGIHVVRFHFFFLPSFGNVSDFRFSVSASGFQLLSNFTVGNRNSSISPPIEEFLLRISPSKFTINFVPDAEGFSAFVNAIEVFLAPPELIPDSDSEISHVTPEREEKSYTGLVNNILHIIHRINVGGQNIMPNNDTLLRYWIPDDDVGFMINKNAARITDPYAGPLNYLPEGSTSFIAPDNVYKTAKQMNIINQSINDFNVSWRFDVRKGSNHLVRVHFCDIVSQALNGPFKFNLYIYSKFKDEIHPYNHVNQLASPFYIDYVVKSDDSGFMNISIGPSNNSEDGASAFLNGVEIMEVIGNATSSHSSSRNRVRIFVGLGVGGGILILVLVILAICFVVSRKKKWKPVEAFDWPLIPYPGGSSYSRTTVRTVSDSPSPDLNLGLRIPFAEILYATNKFNPKFMIGKGGFGKVYKGILRNGIKVAVKRSEPEHGQGISEFQTEIVILSKIRHRHLVSLIGYCDERAEMILVYEFMEKGTLRDHLYTSEGEPLSDSRLWWDERLQICIGAAKGIHYLHTGSTRAIIHRDIKSTNILLDEHYIAKVADFGLSHSGPRDESHVSTQVKGSFGYLDPEYFRFSQLTQKSDVYSFGVVLLEVLCARPAINPTLPREQVNLADWGLTWIRKGQLDKITDPVLVGKINPNCLKKYGETVEKCLQDSGTDRPNMVDVLWDLEYCLKLQHTAVPSGAYDDSTTMDFAMGLPMPVLGRLPSDTIGTDELAESSRVDGAEVFSQLRLGEAR